MFFSANCSAATSGPELPNFKTFVGDTSDAISMAVLPCVYVPMHPAAARDVAAAHQRWLVLDPEDRRDSGLGKAEGHAPPARPAGAQASGRPARHDLRYCANPA